jgi:hypothetical protein
MTTRSRWTFVVLACAFGSGVILGASSIGPSLATTPSPDAKLIEAADAWLLMCPEMQDLLDRQVIVWDASIALVGECPMLDHAANKAWHIAWNEIPCGKLQWAWEDLSEVTDGHLTVVMSTPAQSSEEIRTKVRLYRVARQ